MAYQNSGHGANGYGGYGNTSGGYGGYSSNGDGGYGGHGGYGGNGGYTGQSHNGYNYGNSGYDNRGYGASHGGHDGGYHGRNNHHMVDLNRTPSKNSMTEVEMAGSGGGRGPSDEHDEMKFGLEHAETYQTTYEQAVEGKLYQDGELVMMPAPSRDPMDPMNIPFWHKFAGIFCLSFFGALAASAEIILGACLPVFAVYYAGVPVDFLNEISLKGGLPANGHNGLWYLDHLGPNAKPVFDIYLLAALPLLVIGVANLFLIPLAIAVGRRPVLLITGVIALTGAIWAGASASLEDHIGARCVQAVGAGTVESLIPFIIQDMVYVHQRNTWISCAFAAQGVIIIAIGFSAPYAIINLNWRWVYYITAIAGGFFLFGVFLFLPETRWNRTRSEMSKLRPVTAKNLRSLTHMLQTVCPATTRTSSTHPGSGGRTSTSGAARPSGARGSMRLSIRS